MSQLKLKSLSHLKIQRYKHFCRGNNFVNKGKNKTAQQSKFNLECLINGTLLVTLETQIFITANRLEYVRFTGLWSYLKFQSQVVNFWYKFVQLAFQCSLMTSNYFNLTSKSFSVTVILGSQCLRNRFDLMDKQVIPYLYYHCMA